jgi:hypothetical protein
MVRFDSLSKSERLMLSSAHLFLDDSLDVVVVSTTFSCTLVLFLKMVL